MQRYSLDKWELLIIKVVLNIGVLNTKTNSQSLLRVDDGAPFDYFSEPIVLGKKSVLSY